MVCWLGLGRLTAPENITALTFCKMSEIFQSTAGLKNKCTHGQLSQIGHIIAHASTHIAWKRL